MRPLPFLLALASVALAGCPPPGALVVLDEPERVVDCGQPLQYGYLEPVTSDSLAALLASDRVGSPIVLILRNGAEIEAASPVVADGAVRYTPDRSTSGAAIPLREVARLVVPVRTYGPGDVIAFVFRGRYENLDVLVGCDS